MGLVPLHMMKNKKWLLLLIILFPSVFWLILETSTINSRKLPHYGPKSFNGKDTLFYSVNNLKFLSIQNGKPEAKQFDTINYPIAAVVFIKEKYAKENFRLEGLLDYTQHQKSDIDKIPFLLVYENSDTTGSNFYNLKDSLHISLSNIEQCFWRKNSFDSINFYFFKEKPVYIDYSFIALVDVKRHIRGFYDGRYSAEVKRLLQEYKHLRIKEEKKIMIQENEIKTKSSD